MRLWCFSLAVLCALVLRSAALDSSSQCGYSGDYYAKIDTSLSGKQFMTALQDLINNHTVLTYNALWTAFKLLDEHDVGCQDGLITDIYSSYCWKPEVQQCGTYHKEGDCYNREHSWPKSWWGGFDQGHDAQTDLFHLYPTDGYVNGRRSSFALGVVGEPSYVSSNGGKVGKCASEGFSGTCFEPADEYKGDLARSYFYISTAYMDLFTCCDVDGVDGSHIKPWMETVLRQWHKGDPVSEKECTRNELIFGKLQYNRNPFIDYPEWVDKIADF